MCSKPRNSPLVGFNVRYMEKQPTILVVDDLELNRLTARTFLERMGYRVLDAHDGVRALHIVESNSVDLILMDCQMPVMNGFEATQQLRGRRVTTPIVAYTTDDNRDECLSVGMNAHLPKPANRSRLRETIEFWLQSVAPLAA
jgi:CheY-like chemotaxis protein